MMLRQLSSVKGYTDQAMRFLVIATRVTHCTQVTRMLAPDIISL